MVRPKQIIIGSFNTTSKAAPTDAGRPCISRLQFQMHGILVYRQRERKILIESLNGDMCHDLLHKLFRWSMDAFLNCSDESTRFGQNNVWISISYCRAAPCCANEMQRICKLLSYSSSLSTWAHFLSSRSFSIWLIAPSYAKTRRARKK